MANGSRIVSSPLGAGQPRSFGVVAVLVLKHRINRQALAATSASTTGPRLAANDRHVRFQHAESDRRTCFRLDRIRRVRLRQTNELMDANVSRPRPDDLSLLRQ